MNSTTSWLAAIGSYQIYPNGIYKVTCIEYEHRRCRRLKMASLIFGRVHHQWTTQKYYF